MFWPFFTKLSIPPSNSKLLYLLALAAVEKKARKTAGPEVRWLEDLTVLIALIVKALACYAEISKSRITNLLIKSNI